jgi:tetratricopeptide (TPR) repeat protein
MTVNRTSIDDAGAAAGPAGRPAVRQPRRARVLRGVVLGLLAVGPFAFAVATPGPHVPAGSGSTSTVETIPTLPADGRPTVLASVLEPVPMLVDPPDPPSRAAVAAYRAAGMLDPDQVRAAFSSAWEAMQAPGATPDSLRTVEAQLLNPATSDLPPAFDDLVGVLAQDPDNGGRLTNAATMLFTYGVLLDSGVASTPADSTMSYPFLGPAIEVEARAILEAVGQAFGTSVAQLVDQGVVTSLTDYQTGPAEGADLVARALALEPGNPTLRLLLAELQANQPDDPTAWRSAPATLAPLFDDPGTALVGHAGLGDAYLLAASLRSLEAPRTARVLARRAIEEYTTVLEQVSDAEVYAGWARAAALLGHTEEARRAIARAIDLAPGAVAFPLEAASLAEAAGDPEAMRMAAEQALATTATGWDPAISTVRFVPGVSAYLSGFAHPGDLGLLGAGLGSSRDWLAVIRMPQGGGLLADVEVVPRVTDPPRDQWRRSALAPDAAALTALQASVDLGDPQTAASDLDVWNQEQITTSKELVDEVSAELQQHLWAAQVVAGGTMPGDAVAASETSNVFSDVDTSLRRAGEFERLEQVCASLATGPPDDSGYDTTPDDARQCVGDARFLQGDPEGAVTAYSDAIHAYDAAPPASLLIRRGAAILASHPGSQSGRADLVRAATSDAEDGDVATAFIVLAGDDLEAGQVAVAEAHYDLALDLLDIERTDNDDQGARAGVRQAWVQALTNRGVARLRMAQGDPQQPPDCTVEEHRADCRAADADFDAALRSTR